MDSDKDSFSKQDPSFIPKWLSSRGTMRMSELTRNTADHYRVLIVKKYIHIAETLRKATDV